MQYNFVDVWYGQLTDKPSSLHPILSEEERQKAESFKLPVMRQRYIAVRTELRKTLATYLDVEPAQLSFQIGAHGKPHLADDSLHFNISHTADHLIIAVSNIANIGVDIEIIKPRTGIDNLAARCFSSAELCTWHELPTKRKLEAFYRVWTKKEAFVKAVGRGIALGLEYCEMDIHTGGQLQRIPSEFGQAADWRLIELPLGNEQMAALATPNCSFNLRRMFLNTDPGDPRFATSAKHSPNP